jgi:hypothetical protein
MKMNGQPGNENRQVEIDPGKSGKTKRNREQVESFHEQIIQRSYKVERVTML